MAEEDLYSDGGGASAPDMETEVEETETTETEETESKADSAGTPGLLPKDFFHGKELKPGTVCEVKVERILDGQVEISYVPHSKKSEKTEEVETDSEMESLMT